MIDGFRVEQETLEGTSYPVVGQLKAEQLRDHTKMYVAYLLFPPLKRNTLAYLYVKKYDKSV